MIRHPLGPSACILPVAQDSWESGKMISLVGCRAAMLPAILLGRLLQITVADWVQAPPSRGARTDSLGIEW